jgi:hypothetical protein
MRLIDSVKQYSGRRADTVDATQRAKSNEQSENSRGREQIPKA